MERAGLRTINRGIGVIAERQLNQKSFNASLKSKHERRKRLTVLKKTDSNTIKASAGEHDDKIVLNNNKNYDNGGVSVIISAWNTAEYIEECLDSVAAQTWFKNHENWEILLGIDACEKTLEKVKSIMHKYKNLTVLMMNENVGTYVTCNTLITESRYEYIQRFDSDDIMLPHMISVLMDKYKNYDFVNPGAYDFPDNFNEKKNGEGQMFFKRSVFETYGGFRDFRCGCDTEFRVRTRGHIKQIKTDEVLFLRRKHDGSLTKDTKTTFGSEYRNKVNSFIKTTSRTVSKIETKIGKHTLISGPKIIVSFTTWKKRQECAAKMLMYFKKQLLQPNKIICYLSLDEYNGENIPESLRHFVDENYIEIKWVKQNIFSYKRYEIFKEHISDYVMLIDDDIYYDPYYIQKMYMAAKQHPDNIICYTGNKINFEKDRILLPLDKNPSQINTILSGVSCYPPNIFPMEYFDYDLIRDKTAPKCDDSFMRILAIKNNIKIFCIYDRTKKTFNTIKEYQNVGIWNENKKKIEGVSTQGIIFKNLVHAFNLEAKCKKLWPKIDL